jgi:hypothetical protein
VASFSNLHFHLQLVAFDHSSHTGTVIAGPEQNTGKASRTDYRGRGTEHMALGLELGQVERQRQVLQEGNTHLEEGDRRTLDRMILEQRRSEEQEFDARSSCRPGGGEGMPPRGEGRRSSEWAKKTTVPEDREGTLVIVVVVRVLRLEARNRRNVEEREAHGHLQTGGPASEGAPAVGGRFWS